MSCEKFAKLNFIAFKERSVHFNCTLPSAFPYHERWEAAKLAENLFWLHFDSDQTRTSTPFKSSLNAHRRRRRLMNVKQFNLHHMKQ